MASYFTEIDHLITGITEQFDCRRFVSSCQSTLGYISVLIIGDVSIYYFCFPPVDFRLSIRRVMLNLLSDVRITQHLCRCCDTSLDLEHTVLNQGYHPVLNRLGAYVGDISAINQHGPYLVVNLE
jgi:hypothetical protein